MIDCFTSESHGKDIKILPIVQSDFSPWLALQDERLRTIVMHSNFTAKSNQYFLIFGQHGELEKVLFGLESLDSFLSFGVLPKVLPSGVYRIEIGEFSSLQLERAAIGWGMGSYCFDRYKNTTGSGARLNCEGYALSRINSILQAIYLARNLINIPAADLCPQQLAATAVALAQEFQAKVKVIEGEELAVEFPTVYAVGKGSEKKPLLIDLEYGNGADPRVVLVGKGVCFDSGGLQLKSSSHMMLMKKDMAGAAHALAIARLIMEAKLRINLRVIIPAVENLPSGDSLKPNDIIRSRSGITIEVGNTDAEGRLILADALSYASEWKPQLILDFATLTGAARVALGPSIAALFANGDNLADDLVSAMNREGEPVWRLPLHDAYEEYLESDMADMLNVAKSDNVGGGAILGALMLQKFVAPDIEWAHFDINAYNNCSKPGKPKGGEADCVVGVFKYLEQRFS